MAEPGRYQSRDAEKDEAHVLWQRSFIPAWTWAPKNVTSVSSGSLEFWVSKANLFRDEHMQANLFRKPHISLPHVYYWNCYSQACRIMRVHSWCTTKTRTLEVTNRWSRSCLGTKLWYSSTYICTTYQKRRTGTLGAGAVLVNCWYLP